MSRRPNNHRIPFCRLKLKDRGNINCPWIPVYDPHFPAPRPLEESPCGFIEPATIYVQQDNEFFNGGVRKLGIDKVLHLLGFMQEDTDIELQLAPVATSKCIPALMEVEAAKSLAIWAISIIITVCTPKRVSVFAGIPRRNWPSPNDKPNPILAEFSAN